MNFNTIEFLIFLPFTCLIHWLLPSRYRCVFLLAASYLFYFIFQPYALFLLFGVTLFTWLCARQIEQGNHSRLYLGSSIFVTLTILAVFKYSNANWLLPAGISFYTFQTLSYVIDVYKGQPSEKQFTYYALFVSFFPQLVAGPIERPGHLCPQLHQERSFDKENVKTGLVLLMKGFFKKIVIADGLAMYVDQVYGDPANSFGLAIIISTILFGVQILCDFSGYTDISRGSAKMLGIDLMENFKQPYDSENIRDFWRRWHVSLSSWLSDYVYIPLGGNHKHHFLNIWIVFVLSGIWHGAGWHFVLWGVIHALYQTIEILTKGKYANKTTTIILVTFAWLFFRANSVSDAMALLTNLFVFDQVPYSLIDVVKIILLLVNFHLLEHIDHYSRQTKFYLMLAIVIGWLALLRKGGQNAFIYFQF